MKRWQSMTLQRKILLVVALSILLVLLVNVGMFRLLNRLNRQVESVYTSNLSLNALDDQLTSLQNNLDTYVSTKSSDAMEAYYRDEQELRRKVEELNDKIVDNDRLIAEKNIRALFLTYLDQTAEIIQAKRGRNVERYAALFQEAETLSREIHVFISSLNSQQFRNNSVEYASLIRQIRDHERNMETMLVLILLLDMLVVYGLTSLIIKPLRELARAANELAAGDLELPELPIKSHDEIGIVTEAFNQMVASIRDYIRQTRENLIREQELREKELLMEGHLKDAQLKYLQAQIDPHFLFNTLNAGAQLAMMEGAEKTEELLDNTAAFFRYNVRRNKQEATIREEISLVDNYIYICKVRFGDSFVFEKDIDESVIDRRIPSMILQPLIENAFKYGIRDLEHQGRMELNIGRVGDAVEISIWDNGTGMTRERIEQVLAGVSAESDAGGSPSDSNGVGIANVRDRLRLYFDDKAEFEINSEGLGFGTEIVIRIPADVEEE